MCVLANERLASMNELDNLVLHVRLNIQILTFGAQQSMHQILLNKKRIFFSILLYITYRFNAEMIERNERQRLQGMLLNMELVENTVDLRTWYWCYWMGTRSTQI